MPILPIFILTLSTVKLLRDSLFFVWLWQSKEYRMDRMNSYIKENKLISGSNYIYLSGLVLFLIYTGILQNFSTIYSVQSELFYLISPGLIIVYLLISIYYILKEFKRRFIRRPRLTLKIAIIFLLYTGVLSLISLCWLFHSPSIAISSQYSLKMSLLILFVIVANPIIISMIVIAIEPFFLFQKKKIIARASKKMNSLKKIRTIGITGSYGKTSTKEFLYAILSQKYKVVKTEGNNNTNIGVAYTVLNNVSDDFDYFICEMGAYKIGEIKEMCDIVNPQIGILTGINEQHIELFGSMENTIKAKFELIEALPEEGLAVINEKLKYQNEKIRSKVKNIKYFTNPATNNIRVYKDYLEFGYKGKSFKAKILGKHYIENLISAIMVAEHFGMNSGEISRAIEKMELTEYMTRKIEGINGSVYIDDSYSANPDGVIAALDYLKEAYSEYKKIIVFPGFIELGSKSEKIHNELFDRVGKICDTAFILDARYRYSIPNTSNKCKFIFEKDFEKTSNMLKNFLNKNTVVLFESRGAGAVMKKLKLKV